MNLLSRAEELVLLAVWKLKENAYGVTVRKHIIKITSEEWSIGAIYVPLDRLTKYGYLNAEEGDPTSERGGRRKRFYFFTESGYGALKRTRNVYDEMWSDLPEIAFTK